MQESTNSAISNLSDEIRNLNDNFKKLEPDVKVCDWAIVKFSRSKYYEEVDSQEIFKRFKSNYFRIFGRDRTIFK